MPIKKITLTVLLLLALGILALGIYLETGGEEILERYRQKLHQSEQSYAESVLGLNFNNPTPAPLNTPKQPKLIQTGWIPDWDFYNGLASLNTAPSKFDSISPVWYYLNEDGSVNANRVGQTELSNLKSQHGVKVIPSIASFDSAAFHKILSRPKKLTEHINYLKNEVETYGLDGIDLDYESIRVEDQPAYLRLIKELYQYLDSRGKKLTVAVMPSFSEDMPWKSFVQTRQAQHWSTIGMYTHEVRIMTYNITGANSKYPGPIGPLDWLAANLRYARTRVDANKIVLGVHHYAYAGWGENVIEPTPYLSPFENKWTNGAKAAALEYEDILERKQNTVNDKYDRVLGESVLRYTRDGKSYIGYYIDARGIAARKNLAKQFGIKGLAYWRLGDEDTSGY